MAKSRNTTEGQRKRLEAPSPLDRREKGATGMNIAEFQAVTDHYKQDLREFFTRSNFYLAVQGALVYGLTTRERSDDDLDLVVDLGILILGIILCLFWWLVARGSHFWIKTWRKKCGDLSELYSEAESYHEAESLAGEHPWNSPETVTKHLPLLFAVFWIALAIALAYVRFQ